MGQKLKEGKKNFIRDGFFIPEDDIDNYIMFLFIIQNTESFNNIKENLIHESRVKSASIRNHIEEVVLSQGQICVGEDFEAFRSDFIVKKIKHINYEKKEQQQSS